MNATRVSRRAAFRSLLAAATIPAILKGARRPAGDKPNLLFLWTDEQRADTMAVYGNYRFRVPVMNRLAARSIVFDRAYDTQPVCTPARSSVMTGLWPHQTGLITNNLPLPEETRTFPELVADAAYRTGYFGKWHLGDEPFAQHGFQEWISIEDIYNEYFRAGRDRSKRSDYHHFLLRLGYKPDAKDGRFSRLFAVQRPLEHCKPAFLAGEASNFILRHRDEPWMLYVNFLEPHMPFFGPLNDLHSEQEAPIPQNYPGIPVEMEPKSYGAIRAQQQKTGSNQEYIRVGGQRLPEREAFARLNRNYAGLCSQVDQALGRILWALEASGQADNTIIVFTSDHGEMMGAHTLLAKSVLYEEAVRVPLLISVPWRHRGQLKVERPVSHIDLVPTLLELMGRQVPENLAGESLLGLLEGRKRREEDVFIQWNEPPKGPDARAIVTPDGWKMAVYDTDNSLLFHGERDPLEMENLYYRKEHAATARLLRAKLEAWQQRTGDKLRLPA